MNCCNCKHYIPFAIDCCCNLYPDKCLYDNMQTKKDITRLKNLLRLYRDHIITNHANKGKNLLNTIKEIDNSIYLIHEGL